MKKHLFWILPAIVIIIGICLIFNRSMDDVTEQPEENWSRSLKIGKTSVDKKLPVRENGDGNVVTQTYDENMVRFTTFNDNVELMEETTFDISFDKRTQVFLHDDQLIYHDYRDICYQDGNVIIPDAKRFYPLDNTVLYINENSL